MAARHGVVAITGASGYVGTLAARRYAAAGWTVLALQRRDDNANGVATRRFVLGQPVDASLLNGVDVLIHCAWDLDITDAGEIDRVNVEGTRRLWVAAAAAGVKRIVLISSMSAYWGTDQVYGRAKLACEEAAAAVGGTSVRLGLVYGPGWGGMAGSLRKLVQLPVTPLLGARSYQYTVHQDDVAEGLFAIGTAPSVPAGPIGLAHPERVPFRELLRAFGRQAGAAPRLVPLPWRPVYQAMRLMEKLHVALPLRSDSLLGLVRPAGFVPCVQTWKELGVSIRPFALGLPAPSASSET
jgi:nucleoside-diphosphate-sugar epimerase